ncbi:hypothetical protein GUJ93_ZPchr0010g11091 [Zizania palustris]|uniref:Uncharacterized protein n=1 Tax=Zizania palustris TaxID=103762 RepID=A0A8J5W7V4_ZIZPA|nr:hypothetical protein GUJ93_ZPchr0010g11091 [Zizania palustris]
MLQAASPLSRISPKLGNRERLSATAPHGAAPLSAATPPTRSKSCVPTGHHISTGCRRLRPFIRIERPFNRQPASDRFATRCCREEGMDKRVKEEALQIWSCSMCFPASSPRASCSHSKRSPCSLPGNILQLDSQD